MLLSRPKRINIWQAYKEGYDTAYNEIIKELGDIEVLESCK